MKFYIVSIWLLLLTSIAGVSQADVVGYNTPMTWSRLTHHPKKLEVFLKHMPKGADLHCHASGAVSTEILIKLAASNPYCIDSDFNLTMMQHNQCSKGEPTTVFLQVEKHRQQALKAWSIEQFYADDKEDKKTHFFNSFAKFDILVKQHRPEIIANVVQVAHEQNIQYLELMLSLLEDKPNYTQLKMSDDITLSQVKTVLANPKVKKFVSKNIVFFKNLKSDVKRFTPLTAQDVALSWILEIKRNQPFDQFCLDAIEAFEVANQVSDIAAINLVQPEYFEYSRQDYVKQMQWLKTLKTHYPKIKLVLHAGEMPNDIKNSHIKQAMLIAKPLRIGHGTDIENEVGYLSTLKLMRKKHIAVEVNLTSNDDVFGVKGARHPLHLFMMSKVPVVLSSDDPGISRNTLSHEYWRAVQEHEFSLQQLLQVDRNSLSYSLLPGQSIWKNNECLTPVKACRDFHSKSCVKFIANNPKAYQQWILEKRLAQYIKENLREGLA